ncbi:MAG: PAS domain S-box protein, partial [Anaerolineae bacterium]|nr:PAS domain S-box protein [Anaerolineae bacterium]
GNLEHILLVGAFETITGYTPEEYMAAGGWRASLYPDDVAQDERDMAVLRSNQRVITELRIIRKDGEIRWVRVYAHPVWDAALNRLVAINGAVQDITARKMAEESLQRSEAFLRALLDATTDVAFLMSLDGEFLTLNKTLAESIHKAVGAMVGQNVYDILKPDVAASRRQRFDEVIASRLPVRWQDQSDATFWDNQAYPILSPTGSVEAFAVYGREITEQKRLEAELQRYTAHLEQMVEERTAQLRLAKEQVETILNNTRDAVALAHLNGDIETRNPAFVTMFGDQVASRIEHILWTISDADQSALVGEALMKVIYEQEHQRVEARIASGNGVDRDVDLAFIPVRAADSATPHSLLVSAHDITHLKEIERFKERFVADAVHDLATPISGLSTRLYLLKKMPENTGEHIEALENQVEHLRNLLTELRTLSQLDRGILVLSLQPCNLNRIVARIVATYEPVAIEKGQLLTLNLAPTLPETLIDSHQIERVFVNLISNAINYTASGKTIRIETQVADDGVMFKVTDEGIGIGADDLPHVFGRFYRTAKARDTHAGGTGLGLAIVKEIVELHGGRVTVESTVDQGSTFTVWLPVKPDQSAISKG